MNTGRGLTTLLLLAIALTAGCASRQPQAILSASELDSMISVRVTPLEPAMQEGVVAANDHQP